MSLVKKILKNKSDNKTLFSTTEIGQLLNVENEQSLYSSLNYAVQSGDLVRPARGLYALDESYSRLELGNKLRKPSYVSLYTVLQANGIVFQVYTTIYLIARSSGSLVVNGQGFVYRKIKDDVLLNPLGLIAENSVIKATAERALCDKIYLDKDEYFDNLRNIDWEFMKELNEKVYENKNVESFIGKNSLLRSKR